MKLDLACGPNKAAGYVGVDLYDLPGVDIQHDLLSFPWPFVTGSVEAIRCVHYIEHIDHAYWTPNEHPMHDGCHGTISARPVGRKSVELLLRFFDECWRVLKPGGIMEVAAPHAHSDRAWQDPSHRRAIVPETFNYLSRKFRAINGPHGASCDFLPFVLGKDGERAYGQVDQPSDAEQDARIQEELRRLPPPLRAAEHARIVVERWNAVSDVRVLLEKVGAPLQEAPAPDFAERQFQASFAPNVALNEHVVSCPRCGQAPGDLALMRSCPKAAVLMDKAGVPSALPGDDEPHLFRVTQVEGGLQGGISVTRGNMEIPGVPIQEGVFPFTDGQEIKVVPGEGVISRGSEKVTFREISPSEFAALKASAEEQAAAQGEEIYVMPQIGGGA